MSQPMTPIESDVQASAFEMGGASAEPSPFPVLFSLFLMLG